MIFTLPRSIEMHYLKKNQAFQKRLWTSCIDFCSSIVLIISTKVWLSIPMVHHPTWSTIGLSVWACGKMISFFEFDSKRLRVDAYALNHTSSIHIAQIKWAEEPFGRMGGMGEFVGFWLCHDKIHLYPPQGSVIFLWPYDPSPSWAVSCL